ncbi:winged helix DNA-binding domain-containing protein [Actinocrispum sp. NPDC049592]|uniref:winged helix DNA-binding domain-containing protein n=1 Tax=Actinocrispum sp. NPDC049592 TaxID=3154835 RepID=UPI0034294C5B
MAPKISLKALNRATLDRQLLLERSTMSPLAAVEHLVGLQAQTTSTWYHGLWSRLVGFDPRELSDLLARREVVRMALMRSTIHLVSARDALFLRPLVQIVSERGTASIFGKNLKGLDLDEVLKHGRELLDQEPMVFSELGRRMAERWDRDPASLAQAVRAHVPLVQIPPRGLWGGSGLAKHSTVETWLGKAVDENPSVEDMVLRYLKAFGPASVRDAQTWSGLTRLNEVFDRLRPQLVTFADENGRELFDLPGSPRPDEETPAPPRFLYDFDNLLLSHDDRSRVVTEPARLFNRPVNGLLAKLFLVDGFTAGQWTIEQDKDTAVLNLKPYRKLTRKEIAALTKEAKPLFDFVAPKSARRDLRVV